jgi:hypothetical protein
MELFDHGYVVTTRVLHSNDGTRSNTSQYVYITCHCQKARAFSKHLADVFQLQPSENESKEEALIQLLEASYHLEPPIKRLKKLKF